MKNNQSDSSFEQLIERWRTENCEMESYLDGVREWMYEVSNFGWTRFGEAANRLARLHDRLVMHFAREDQIGQQLNELLNGDSDTLIAMCRKDKDDHRALVARLDNLIERLDQLEPPFVSWEVAMDEVEAFVASLEQHADEEADSIAMLKPKQ